MRRTAAEYAALAASELSPLDRSTIVYALVAVTAILVLWPPSHPTGPAPVVILHLALAACALVAPRARRAGRLSNKAGRLAAFIGEFYPLFVTTAFYLSVGVLNRARGISHDGVVQRWEELVFGGQPSVLWIRAYPSPVLSTALHFGYLSYFGIVAVAVFLPWFVGRREAAREVALLTMRTFYCCWTIFMLFPVAGPRHLFPPADNAATQTALAVLTHAVVDDAGSFAWGTAFPSSHVAASMVAATAVALRWRALGAVLLPLAVLLALGTVYGQFHYALDAVAGLVVAIVVLSLRPRTPTRPVN